MIKAEIFENRALLLDDSGRIWEFIIGHDDQPKIRMVKKIERETINSVMMPQLARIIPSRF